MSESLVCTGILHVARLAFDFQSTDLLRRHIVAPAQDFRILFDTLLDDYWWQTRAAGTVRWVLCALCLLGGIGLGRMDSKQLIRYFVDCHILVAAARRTPL